MQMGTATLPRTQDRVKLMLCALPGQGPHWACSEHAPLGLTFSHQRWSILCSSSVGTMCFMHMTNRRLQSHYAVRCYHSYLTDAKAEVQRGRQVQGYTHQAGSA